VSLDRIFFLDHPAERLPLWWAAGMCLFYLLVCLVLRLAVKERSAWKLTLGFSVLFMANFAAMMEYQAGRVEEAINSSALADRRLQMDMLLFYKLRKSSVFNSFLWNCTVNAKGVRSRTAIPYEKGKDEFRVLVLGDSWTFGVAVNDDETFCAVAERLLRRRYPGRPITFINAGVPGYCSAQGLLYLQRELIRYSPDLVVVKNFLNGGELVSFRKIYPLPSPAWKKALRLALWRSSFYLHVRRLVIKAAYGRDAPGRDEGAQVAEDDYLFHKEIFDWCAGKKIPTVFLDITLKGVVAFQPEFDRFLKDPRLRCIKLELDPAVDPEALRWDRGHPGARNNALVGSRLAQALVDGGYLSR